jgi:hypothetical protein
MIDNVAIQAGETVAWSYEMTYRGAPLVDINIRHQNDDEYLDIVLFPGSACTALRWDFVNTSPDAHRSYDTSVTDLREIHDEAIDAASNQSTSTSDAVLDNISDTIAQQDLSQLTQDIGEQRAADFLDDLDLNIALDLDSAISPEVTQAYQDITQ